MKKIIAIMILMFGMLGFSMPTLDEAVTNLRNAGLSNEDIVSYTAALQMEDSLDKITYLENLVKNNPRNIYAKMDLAALYISSNQYITKSNEIESYLIEGINFDTNNEFPYEKLLEFYSLTGQNDKILGTINGMLSALPDYPLGYFYAINYLLLMNDPNAVLTLVPVAVERFENTPEKYLVAYLNKDYYISDIKGANIIVNLTLNNIQEAIDYYVENKESLQYLDPSITENIKNELIKKNEEAFRSSNRRVYNANLRKLR